MLSVSIDEDQERRAAGKQTMMLPRTVVEGAAAAADPYLSTFVNF
jgi:hypothetical protein